MLDIPGRIPNDKNQRKLARTKSTKRMNQVIFVARKKIIKNKSKEKIENLYNFIHHTMASCIME